MILKILGLFLDLEAIEAEMERQFLNGEANSWKDDDEEEG